VVSRDPHLLATAVRRGWRQLSLVEGRLAAAESLAIAAPATPVTAEDSLPIDIVYEEPVETTDPGDAPEDVAPAAPGTTQVIVPKVLPFPITARSRGVG
jgi:hypothetical protein